MPYSYHQYTGDGVLDTYAFSKPYLSTAHVTATADGVPVFFTWVSTSTIKFDLIPALGAAIDIRRTTPIATAPVDWNDGSVLVEADMDLQALTIVYALQEALDLAGASIRLDDEALWDALSTRITNVADAVDAQDAATYAQLIAATVAAGNVGAPINPTDDGKVLTASGGAWSWVANTVSTIVDTAAFMKTFLLSTTSALALTNLGVNSSRAQALGDASVENVAVGGTGDLLRADGDGSGLSLVASPLPGYVDGLTLSNSTIDAANDIDIAVGAVVNDSYDFLIQLASPLTKQLDAVWAAGTDAGWLDTGTVATNTWYHVYLIRNSTTGVVDSVCSLSPTAPTMPAGYDQKQCIGRVLYETTAIRPFWQTGDRFLWDQMHVTFYETSPNAIANTRTLLTPTGVALDALFQITLFGDASPTNEAILVTPLYQTDSAPSRSNPQNCTLMKSGNGQGEAVLVQVRTNELSQIRTRNENGGANNNTSGQTVGWIDPRGKRN